jgi:hypothetical protein
MLDKVWIMRKMWPIILLWLPAVECMAAAQPSVLLGMSDEHQI